MPDFFFLVQSEVDTNQRLDVFLTKQIPGLTRSQLKKLIEGNQVRINSLPTKGAYKLRLGDRIEGNYSDEEPGLLIPQDIPLDIVFQDDDLVIINKPSGMVVHPGTGTKTGTLAHALKFHFPGIALLGPPMRPGIVHRLDKDTSGLIVAALSEASFVSLKNQFKMRQVDKMYLALVWGRMPGQDGLMDWPIGRHPKLGEKMSIKTRNPRDAKTLYEVEREYGQYSLLRLKPITGRTHQIRVHLAASGHPVVGDPLYGGRRKKSTCPRLFLHAFRLAFDHPVTGVRICHSAPLPEDLQSFLDRLED